MHRVELKVTAGQSIKIQEVMFLMHRVELKALIFLSMRSCIACS